MDWKAKVELFEQLRREHEFGIGRIAGVAAKFGVHRRVVRRAIAGALPPVQHYPERTKPKLGAVADFIDKVLDDDRRVLLDPEDPLFLLVTLFREVQKETLTQLTKVVADATDKSVGASTAAEAAARAKAESIVSQAGEWAGLKIREACDLVLTRIQAEMQSVNASAQAAARWQAEPRGSPQSRGLARWRLWLA